MVFLRVLKFLALMLLGGVAFAIGWLMPDQVTLTVTETTRFIAFASGIAVIGYGVIRIVSLRFSSTILAVVLISAGIVIMALGWIGRPWMEAVREQLPGMGVVFGGIVALAGALLFGERRKQE